MPKHFAGVFPDLSWRQMPSIPTVAVTHFLPLGLLADILAGKLIGPRAMVKDSAEEKGLNG